MKKSYLIICLLLFASELSFGRDKPLANNGKSGLYSRSIEQVLRLQEEDVDLATAALIVSEVWSDLVPGRRHLSALDDMALEIRERLKRRRFKPDFRSIPVINEYLFNDLGFKSISEATDPNDLFLHTVLDKKRGYCLSLSILYLSIGERLGIPLYGVVVPGHFFIRYDDKRVRFNIETTSKGGNASDEHYIKKFKVPPDNDNSIYMKNLNKIQTLGCFFNNLGNSYSDIGETESALLALERAVQINPALSESRANLGNIYLQMKRISDAIYEYQTALQINPNDAKTHNNLGNAYIEKDWLTYAVREYSQSLELDPNFIDAHKNLAVAYTKQKRFGQAISQLKQAIILEPKNAGCYSQLGDVYFQMSRYKEATLQYKKALKIDRNLVDANYGLALCYNKLGMVKEEIAAYKKVLAVKPDMLSVLVNLGNIYFEQHKLAEAIELYERAVLVKPDEGMIHYNIGAAYSNLADYNSAVTAYLKAVEIDPSIGDAHYGLAFGFFQLKQFDLAWKHINIAKKLGVKVEQKQLDAIKSRL